jgi:transposase
MKGVAQMSTKNSPTKYTEEYKKTIVSLYQSGKTYAQIQAEYGVSSSALSNWVKKYSQVQVDDDTILSAQQVKALQKRNAELEEENLILKKAIAIFTPHSDRD